MEREEKRQGLMVERLKRGILVGKRGGPSTPPPTWRLEFPSQRTGNNKNPVQEFLHFPTSTVSARKLCANLWEIQPHQQTPLAKMSKRASRLRRRRRSRRRHHHSKDTVFEVPQQFSERDPPDSPFDQPASASSLRHGATSLVQHHRSVERDGCALKPVSPVSCSSPMEVAPYNCAVTPTCSLDLEGRIGESSYNLKTSTELLKVLNRIWSLEEQHASNMSAVKALKMKLDHCQAQVKKLLREKQMNRQEMVNLMNQMTEDKLVRQSKEHDRIKAAVQSVREELEDERRLRKHSESLHRRTARKLSELKSSFSRSLRSLERERNARILLENLCDEFAKGIRDYEQEVRSLRKNSKEGQVKGDGLDGLIHHISEAWLHDRMQMKLSQAGNDLEEINSIVDKLGLDIEIFHHAKRSVHLKKYVNSSPEELKEIYPCQRHSLDSFPLNEAISAPQNIVEEDSVFEPKWAAGEGLDKLNSRLQSISIVVDHQEKKESQHSMRKHVQSKEIIEDCQANVGRNISGDNNERLCVERKSTEMGGDNEALLEGEATQGPQERDRTGTQRMKSSHSHRLDNLVGNSSLSSEGDKVCPEGICMEDSCLQSVVKGNGSPIKQWKSKLIVSDVDKFESYSKLLRRVKENTLMAKLLEARLEGLKSSFRARKSSF